MRIAVLIICACLLFGGCAEQRQVMPVHEMTYEINPTEPPAPQPVSGEKKEPAQIGEWVAANIYMPKYEYQTVYCRISEVKRGVNGEESLTQLTDENLEYCELKYEVYFPPEFIAEAEDARISFEIVTTNGGAGKANEVVYPGITSVLDTSYFPGNYSAGDTFTRGKGSFVMPVGYTDFLLVCTHSAQGRLDYSYIDLGSA